VTSTATTDTYTREAPAPFGQARRPRQEWLDRLVGSDPGLNRLRNASMSVLTIGLVLVAEWLFVHFTHALQIQTHGATLSAAAQVQAATADHEFLVIGMLLGAIVGMISAFGIMDRTPRGQLTTTLLMPIPMVGALALGLGLGGYRLPSLVALVAILALGAYLRRFGPRGMVTAMLLFIGDFFGYFVHGAISLSEIGWLTAEIGVGVLVAIVVRFGVFYPHPDKALARTQRSFEARSRKVTALALEAFEASEPSPRLARRIHRQLVRLNEAALMIDAQLGDANAIADGSSGQRFHQRLFDVELAVSNLARFALAMGRLDLPRSQRQHVRGALLDIVKLDYPEAKAQASALMAELHGPDTNSTEMSRLDIVIPHRFAGSVIDLADAIAEWTTLDPSPDDEPVTFEPSVTLFGGMLPGSAQVSATASTQRGHHFWGRVPLEPYTRTAIQMAVAVGAAVALGDLLSPRRFYWAVIAAFITFMGTNNAGEQTRKAVFRVVGTVVGIGIGTVVVNLVGHHTYWSIAVILVSLLFGFYLMRINYIFMVVAITVMVSQLYVQLGEFSDSLLLLRLEETALGSGVAIAVVLLILPLRTRNVLQVALRAQTEAVAALVDIATGHLLDDDHHYRGDTSLRAAARDIDAAYQAVVATALPLRRTMFGAVDETVGSTLRLASASRHYGRNMVADIEGAGILDAQTRRDIGRASDTLHSSLAVLINAFEGERDGVYVRSSSLFDRAERCLGNSSNATYNDRLPIRDLMLIDQTMASVAGAMNLTVTDYDTAAIGRS
jgi:uncharacterized membrane protein YgaE (UPF0421/DUF939 family)